MSWKLLFLLGVPMLGLAAQKPAAKGDYLMYVGTYTGQQSKGIYVYRFQPATGEVSEIGLAAETQNPSWVVAHPSGEYLYAANETRNGTVSAFRIDRQTGKLTLLNQVSSHGRSPCAMAVDETGKYLLVANYGTGTVALLPIKTDGSLAEASVVDQHKGSSADPQRQKSPHAHSTNFAPGNRFALVSDLGMDRVFIYRFDAAKGTLVDSGNYGAPPAGSGPRHFAFSPNGKYGYGINELTTTVTAYAWDGKAGTLKALNTLSAVPADFKGEKDGAEVHVSPNGKFVYASTRAEANGIAQFRIDPAKGTVAWVGQVPSGGTHPRYFGFDPSGRWVLAGHEKTNNIVIFKVDPATGKLTPSGKELKLGSPVSIEFVRVK